MSARCHQWLRRAPPAAWRPGSSGSSCPAFVLERPSWPAEGNSDTKEEERRQCSLPTILTALHTHEHEHAHAHTCTSTCTCTIPPPYPSSTVRSRTREDRFHHNDRSRAQRGGIGASLQQGVVMSRKKAETQRLPDACYDVRPASKPPRGHNWLQQTVIMCLDLPRCAPRT